MELNYIDTTTYYTKTARVLHWLMAFIFLVAWIIGFFTMHALSGENIEHGLMLHKSIASVLVFLLIVRIFWRFTHPVPALPTTIPRCMQVVTHLGHFVLYVILILLPVSGAIVSWSAGYNVPVLYLFNLPRLIAENPSITPIAVSIHTYTAWAATLVVAAHVGMAIKHHFIDKDTILISMLGIKR